MANVELVNLSKRYGDVAAVADVSLSIVQGEFVALLGPSGCGKTTTLQMIAGFLEPSGGEILIDGHKMLGVPAHKRNIGVVFQSYALFPHLSVFDNVAFGLRMRKVSGAVLAGRVAAALDLVRLKGFEARYPKELSGGQQQRVALARALVIEPSVLLLDEPLSNLDASLREQMRFEIREIQRRIGITTVFVTHDQAEAMAAADRLVIMNKGRISQAGPVREIYEAPADVFIAGFIGQANLIAGKVLAKDSSLTSIAVDGIGQLVAPSREAIMPGHSVTLMIRPEDLSISLAPVGEWNTIEATVERISYLGATQNIAARAGGAVLILNAGRQEKVPGAGAKAYVSWPPSRGFLIPQG